MRSLATRPVGEHSTDSRVRKRGFWALKKVLMIKSLQENTGTVLGRAPSGLAQNLLTLALLTILMNLIFLVTHDILVSPRKQQIKFKWVRGGSAKGSNPISSKR